MSPRGVVASNSITHLNTSLVYFTGLFQWWKNSAPSQFQSPPVKPVRISSPIVAPTCSESATNSSQLHCIGGTISGSGISVRESQHWGEKKNALNRILWIENVLPPSWRRSSWAPKCVRRSAATGRCVNLRCGWWECRNRGRRSGHRPPCANSDRPVACAVRCHRRRCRRSRRRPSRHRSRRHRRQRRFLLPHRRWAALHRWGLTGDSRQMDCFPASWITALVLILKASLAIHKNHARILQESSRLETDHPKGTDGNFLRICEDSSTAAAILRSENPRSLKESQGVPNIDGVNKNPIQILIDPRKQLQNSRWYRTVGKSRQESAGISANPSGHSPRAGRWLANRKGQWRTGTCEQ